MKILVMGCGLVGGPMALDLKRDPDFDVTVMDRDEKSLTRLSEAGIHTECRDLSSPEAVNQAASGFDLVINALPGFLGFQALKAVIEAGRNIVDIAFFPEDPFLLDALAKAKGVTALVDFGVAPGMSNLLAGKVEAELDRTDSILILVGGLPEIRQWPYEYKAVFSPIDVIEEYTRLARYVENGQEIIRPALTDAEYIDFPGVGTLEAFNTDGLRTLAYTLDVPDMKEKTLRYPGHIQKMAVLRETGFLSGEPVEVNGHMIRPIDLTAKLLFPMWKLQPGEADLTIMRIVVEGEKNGKLLRHQYDLLDRLDPDSGVHSMARTTGYAATMGARMLARGLYRRPGISPPELVGPEKACTAFILEGLAQRNIHFKETISPKQPN